MNKQTEMSLVIPPARARGIQTAVDHADIYVPDWIGIARRYLARFVRQLPPGRQFTTVEYRTWAVAQGCPSPPHNRAWGGPILAASRAGEIHKLGEGPVKSPDSHATKAGVWVERGPS